MVEGEEARLNAPGGVAAVDRALSILAAFEEGDATLTLAELAKRTGLYKSTLLRLAASLERAKFLMRVEGSGYSLGSALLLLGERYQTSFDLGAHVLPALKRLVDETGESASFYVREGEERVCLYRVNSLAHRVLHYVTPGTRLELLTGAAGRILMAFTEPEAPGYERERRERLAVSHQDRKSDTAAIACPVFGARGFIGALSLAGPRFRFTEATTREMSAVVAEAAGGLTRVLGGEG